MHFIWSTEATQNLLPLNLWNCLVLESDQFCSAWFFKSIFLSSIPPTHIQMLKLQSRQYSIHRPSFIFSSWIHFHFIQKQSREKSRKKFRLSPFTHITISSDLLRNTNSYLDKVTFSIHEDHFCWLIVHTRLLRYFAVYLYRTLYKTRENNKTLLIFWH